MFDIPDLPEQRYESIKFKDGRITDVKMSTKCAPCTNGKHAECKDESCTCRNNNHLG